MGAVVSPNLNEVSMWLASFFVMGYQSMFVGLARDRYEMVSCSAPVLLGLCVLWCRSISSMA